MSEGFFYKNIFYVGMTPLVGTNIEDWTAGYNRARAEFLEDLKSECLGGQYGGCLYTMDSDKCDLECPNYKLYGKWEARK